MPAEINIGGVSTERVFLDTDWTKPFKVADIDTDATGATARNIAGYAITFDIRRSHGSTSALLSKTVGAGLTISGTFNSVLATSTQVVTVAVADTDMTTAIFGTNGGVFYYSLKRTDTGAEAVLAYGTITIQRATQA